MKPIGFWMQQALSALLLQHGCFSCEVFLASPQQILEQIQSFFEVKTAVPARAVPPAACRKGSLGVKEKMQHPNRRPPQRREGRCRVFPRHHRALTRSRQTNTRRPIASTFKSNSAQTSNKDLKKNFTLCKGETSHVGFSEQEDIRCPKYYVYNPEVSC